MKAVIKKWIDEKRICREALLMTSIIQTFGCALIWLGVPMEVVPLQRAVLFLLVFPLTWIIVLSYDP